MHPADAASFNSGAGIMIKIIALFAAAACVSLAAGRALADTTSPSAPTIEVVVSGSVTFVPDVAQANLGVRATADTAAGAAERMNARARSMIDALHRLGVQDRDIKTVGYSLYLQSPEPRPVTLQGGPVLGAPQPTSSVYVASESVEVTSSVAKSGAIIDAAIKAGADQSYGISFDTTQRDRLYRAALTKAIQKARDEAQAIAAAAHVGLAGIQSISTGESQARVMPMARAMAAEAGPPIEAGTDTISATVDMVYRIR